jgi:hypothetical protein
MQSGSGDEALDTEGQRYLAQVQQDFDSPNR